MFLEGISYCYNRASFRCPFFFWMVLWCSLYRVCAAGRHVINNDRKKLQCSRELRWYGVDINFAKFGQHLKTHYADFVYFSVVRNWRIVYANQFPSRLYEPIDGASFEHPGRLSWHVVLLQNKILFFFCVCRQKCSSLVSGQSTVVRVSGVSKWAGSASYV